MPDPTTHETFFPSPPARSTRSAPIPRRHCDSLPRRRQQLPAVRLPLLPPARGQGRARPRHRGIAGYNYFSRQLLHVPHPRDRRRSLPHRARSAILTGTSRQRPDPSYVDTSIPSLSLRPRSCNAPGSRIEEHRYDALGSCGNCSQRRRGAYYPGVFHLLLQPSTCRNRRPAAIATPARYLDRLRRPDRDESGQTLPPAR